MDSRISLKIRQFQYGMILANNHYMENSGTSLKSRIEDIEKEEIIKALKECNWVMARAAKSLGITERMIGYKINKYGLRVKEVRWSDGAAEEHEDKQNQKEPL